METNGYLKDNFFAGKTSRIEEGEGSRNGSFNAPLFISGSAISPGHDSTVGVPQSLNIFASWSTSVAPARIGLLFNNSPNTQL